MILQHTHNVRMPHLLIVIIETAFVIPFSSNIKPDIISCTISTNGIIVIAISGVLDIDEIRIPHESAAKISIHKDINKSNGAKILLWTASLKYNSITDPVKIASKKQITAS